MTLATMRNPLARRSLIVLTAAPLLLLVFVIGGLAGAFEGLAQGQRAIISAWKGRS